MDDIPQPVKYDTITFYTGAYGGKLPKCVVEVLKAEIFFLADENDELYFLKKMVMIIIRNHRISPGPDIVESIKNPLPVQAPPVITQMICLLYPWIPPPIERNQGSLQVVLASTVFFLDINEVIELILPHPIRGQGKAGGG